MRLARLAQTAVLCAAALASIATSQAPQPAQPAPPSGGGAGAGPGAPGQDYCFTLRTAQSVTSLCGVGFGACERHRQGAIADGLSTTECVPWSPVACFQLGGDPAPASSWCSANLEDCELWRRADQEKNGQPSPACAWK